MTMKKLLTLSPARIFIVCGLGLALTLGAFWHQQSNQVQLDRMNVLNQGVSTCFNRVSQTFTAMMIKDIQSSYLHRSFMGLSDECLNETVKGINPFRRNVGKGHQLLSRLMSDVHWFHESISKIHSPMLNGTKLDAPLAPLSERYSKMESVKTDLVDAIDQSAAALREVQKNDEILMGAGLIIFVIALSMLSLQEFNRLQLQREIEKQSLNLLKAGQANVGAIVDQIVDRALLTQNMPVTAQIFRDYHGQILERISGKVSTDVKPVEKKTTPKKEAPVAQEENVFVAPVKKDSVVTEEESEALEAAMENHSPMVKSSLKEALVSIQNLHGKDLMQISDVREVQLTLDNESLEQMLNAAVGKLLSRRTDTKKVMISNQIHTDRSIINMFLANATFNASELEFASTPNAASAEIDMNLLILKEIASSSNVSWHIENKADRNGVISGMNIRLVANRVPKDSRAKNLISVVKGKKKDISREMMS